MPRKKIKTDERVVNFLLNPQDKAIIDEMIEFTVKTNAKGKVKVNVTNQIDRLKYCYYFICDYLQEQSYAENLEDGSFIRVNQERMKELLGVSDVAALLDNLISMKIIECDDKFKRGEFSLGYKLLKNSLKLYSFKIDEFSKKLNKIDCKSRNIRIASGIEEYHKAAMTITIDESKLPAIKKEIIKNKYVENENKKVLMRILRLPNLRTLITQYDIKLYTIPYNNLTKSITIINSFIHAQTVPETGNLDNHQFRDAQTVPSDFDKMKYCISAMKMSVFLFSQDKKRDAQTVPDKGNQEKLLSNEIIYQHYGVTVRNMKTSNIIWLSDFKQRKFLDKLDSMVVEDDETTLNRVDRVVSDINNGNIKTSRPKLLFTDKSEKGTEVKTRVKSRVYSNHTNMYRELREIMLLDGKSIIVADLSNSQPLIATLLFKSVFKRTRTTAPPDYLDYLDICQEGKFYEYFMVKCGIDPENEEQKPLRSQFKSQFFSSVFFSKSIEKSNYIRELFIQKYPGCYKAVVGIKGHDDYSMKYKNFPKLLQFYEATIFYDEINVPLLKSGVLAINNYDSICVNNMKDYETAHKMILENFKAKGIKAKLKPEFYGTHKKEVKEMKKKYTVDELLSSQKKNEETHKAEDSTKLQHLKNYEHKKKDDFEKMIKGFQEQDAEDEAKMNRIPRTEEEIYEEAVKILKEGKNDLSKINIDYMVNEIKSAINELDSPVEEKKPYKFVNKYVK